MLCNTDADCSPGYRCVSGVCERECNIDADCPSGYMCRNGACVRKPLCIQRIRVKDDSGNAISQAKVTVNGSVKHTSLFGAPCSFNLNPNVEYEAVASKTGFVCLVCSESFTACTSTITLTLKKPGATTADITFDSTPKGAEVRVDGAVIGNT